MRNRFRRMITGYALLAALLIVFLILNICIGSSGVSLADIRKIIFTHDNATTAGRIIWELRIPRMLSAALLGGALSVSGFLLQTLFANPIAGPYVLGISSGAKLFVALVMVLFLENGIVLSSGHMVIAAFAGSLLAMALIISLSGRVRNMSVLVVCGVLVGYICSAITEFVVSLADDSNIVNLHNWSMGSFSGLRWPDVLIIVIITITGTAFTFALSKPMSAYQLGESYARNLGVNIKRLRWGMILLSSLLSACVTAFAGPVSFVGVAVPHLIKNLFGTVKPVIMIPACFLGGGVFCLMCDLIARSVLAPTELSVSSVTAVFGAPIVIYMMLTKQKKVRS